MINHPNRKQVRLSLSVAELEALRDIIKFAGRLGYHPLSDYARAHSSDRAAPTVASKVEATWEATRS